jgi:hypothetical protein
MTGRHEQAVAPSTTETEIGAALGQPDVTDHDAIGREHGDSVQVLARPPTAPQIAVDIAAKPIDRR